MRRFLFWLSGLFPCRFIKHDGLIFLERYYIGQLFGLTFFLHRFVRSDPDQGLHDHPWRRAWSIILSGWYFEQRRLGTRQVRWFNYLTYESFHRVILPREYIVTDGVSLTTYELKHTPKECWTLFIHPRGRVHRWGFLRSQSFTDIKTQEVVEGQKFIPYRYDEHNEYKKSDDDKWWNRAPLGRDSPRTPY